MVKVKTPFRERAFDSHAHDELGSGVADDGGHGAEVTRDVGLTVEVSADDLDA